MDCCPEWEGMADGVGGQCKEDMASHLLQLITFSGVIMGCVHMGLKVKPVLQAIKSKSLLLEGYCLVLGSLLRKQLVILNIQCGNRCKKSSHNISSVGGECGRHSSLLPLLSLLAS